MRFLSLYIDAFGGVTKRAYDFSDGLTELLDRNGAGKSTLAAFIKAMLYGLDGAGLTRDLSANEFSLYRPWGGGRFGGTLTFSTETGVYRIERYFEDKRGANKHLGEYRVIDTATERPTEAFGEEPGRVLFGVDGESFMRTAYLSSRGLTAARTPDISAKLGGLEGEAWDMSNAEEALRLIEKRRTEIRTKTKQKHGTKRLDVAERELNATRERIAEATAAVEAEARERQTVTEAEARLTEARERLDALTRIKAEADRRMGEEKARNEQIAELSALLARDKEEIARLTHHFPTAPPSPEVLATLEADLSEYNRQRAAVQQADEHPEIPVTDGDVTALRALVKAREEAEVALERLPEADGAAGGGGRPYPKLLYLGILLLFLLLPAGILLLVWRARRCSADAEAARRSAEARENARSAFDEARNKAAAALVACGLSREAGSAEIDTLHAAMLKARLAAEERERGIARMSALGKRIEQTLSSYRDLPTAQAFAVRVDALRALSRALAERQAMLVEHSTHLSRLNGMPRQDSAPTPEEIERLLTALKESIAKDTAIAATARERAEGYRTISDTLDELYDLYEIQRGEVERLSARLSMLDKTAALLTEAKEALEAACLGGIRPRIKAYTDRLLGKRFGEARLDAGLALSFSEGGEGHSAEYFSTGLRAIGDICLRLALTDELYPKDPPPLILDDPFMALDEKNLKEALALLTELAKTRQILYLTCHASRSGKAI